MDRLRASLRLSATLLGRLPAEVSRGELQRFSLMRGLMVDPVFLFSDKPTSRLDPTNQHEVFELLGDVVRAEGLAVLVVSHDVDLLNSFCDAVLDFQSIIVGTTSQSGSENRPAEMARSGPQVDLRPAEEH